MALAMLHTIPGRPEQSRRVDKSGGNWCRGGEVGKGPEEGIACAGRARAILSEMSYELPAVLAPGGPVPMLSAWTDTCLLSSRLTLVSVLLDVTFA